MVAFGMVRKRSTMAWKRPRRVAFGGTVVGSVWISATSACAMKNSGLALWKTATRTSPSASSSRPTRSISWMSARS